MNRDAGCRLRRGFQKLAAAFSSSPRDRLATSAPAAPPSEPITLVSASVFLQDAAFPRALEEAKKIIVIVTPEKNEMSGGVYSIFSIAAEMRRQKSAHGYEIVVVTWPQAEPTTYFRNTNFLNSENIFRFSQLLRCRNLEEALILMPEYACHSFLRGMRADVLRHLKDIPHLRINLLNQNIDFMPPPEGLADLRALSSAFTQTVAHHSYFRQSLVDDYQLPTLLLPAYTNLDPYPKTGFFEKEKLIIHSPDKAPYKEACLSAIRTALPDFKLCEIRDITFDAFMDLATRCLFSVTFGEGFDGYFSQPMQQGGVSFAVFNDRFFPSSDLADCENLFADPDHMIAKIGGVMQQLMRDKDRYDAMNAFWRARIDALYDREDYRRRIAMLVRGEFELFPTPDPSKSSPASENLIPK